jgi:hypothetical protein
MDRGGCAYGSVLLPVRFSAANRSPSGYWWSGQTAVDPLRLEHLVKHSRLSASSRE